MHNLKYEYVKNQTFIYDTYDTCHRVCVSIRFDNICCDTN